MAENKLKPWDQQPDEPDAAYSRFLMYRNLGPARTLDAAFANFLRAGGKNERDGTPGAPYPLRASALGRDDHGEASGERCPLGTDRVAVAAPQAAPLPLPRPQTPGLPGRAHGDRLRPQDGDRL